MLLQQGSQKIESQGNQEKSENFVKLFKKLKF